MRSKIRYRSREADGSPNPVDIVVGQRLRHRRTVLGWSQEQVGDSVGLTFQQVQKYERGANRIGASRLYELSLALDVPVSYFFDGAPQEAKTKIQGFAEDAGVFTHESTVEKREALELIRLFNSIPAGQARRRVISLVRSIAVAVGDLAEGKVAAAGRRGPGRPRKGEQVVYVSKRGPGRPRKADVLAMPQIKRGPGRPRKDEVALIPQIKRGPGRPRKDEIAFVPQSKRGPGRPRKIA